MNLNAEHEPGTWNLEPGTGNVCLLSLLSQCLQQLAVDASEATVGHQHDDITWSMLAHDRVHDGVDVWNVTSLLTAALKIVDQLHRIEALGFRQRRPEHGREDDLIGHAKRAREIVLEDTAA